MTDMTDRRDRLDRLLLKVKRKIEESDLTNVGDSDDKANQIFELVKSRRLNTDSENGNSFPTLSSTGDSDHRSHRSPSSGQKRKKKSTEKLGRKHKSRDKFGQSTVVVPRKLHAQSARSARSRDNSGGDVFPKTKCPDCGISITVKGLQRHRREKHAEKFFKCDLCEFATTRGSSILDHQRRMHFEPIQQGRPGKTNKSRLERSPFRVGVFENRHASSIETLQMHAQMKEALQMNKEELNEMGKKLEEIQVNFKKTEQRVEALEESKNQKEIEIRKVKTRITIIESKQREGNLPDLKDIPPLLNYFSLTKNSTKEDIMKIINLRLMELSPESTVSHEIFMSSEMTDEKRKEISMFYNIFFKKWIKKTKNK